MLQLTDEVLSLKILVCFTPRDIASIGSICRDCVWCKYTWIRSAGKRVNYSSSSSLEETGCWSGFEPSHFDFSACALAITGVNVHETRNLWIWIFLYWISILIILSGNVSVSIKNVSDTATLQIREVFTLHSYTVAPNHSYYTD